MVWAFSAMGAGLPGISGQVLRCWPPLPTTSTTRVGSDRKRIQTTARCRAPEFYARCGGSPATAVELKRTAEAIRLTG
jgi:hypothetical protein